MPDLQFRCTCGDIGHRPSLAGQPWATVAAYAGSAVQWHASRASALRREAPFSLLPRAPAVGERHWLKVTLPFAAVVDEVFWSLFEPPLISWNSVDQDTTPEDIRALSLVRCRLLAGEETDARSGIAEVEVEAVTTLGDLLALNPVPYAPPADFWRLLLHNGWDATRIDGFIHVEGNIEGDEGAWALIRESGADRDLVLYCSWGFHTDHVWAGRARLPADGPRLD
ncbi:MAG: hypothetical protein LCH88_04085 [Proteobacteria bacterium]|nr:hypothetical protein [Pseudomonadota bacterium]